MLKSCGGMARRVAARIATPVTISVVLLAAWVLTAAQQPAQAGTYRIALESNADAPGGSELAIANFNSRADLLAGTGSSLFSAQDIGPIFNLGGFAFAGGQYRLLLETTFDSPSPGEVLLFSYNSLADLLAGNAASQKAVAVDIGPIFNLGGFTFADGQYHLLLETTVDSPSPGELLLFSYNSLADLLAGTAASQKAVAVDISAGFSAGGLAFEPDPIVTVFEPATAAILGVGLAGLALQRRRAAPPRGRS